MDLDKIISDLKSGKMISSSDIFSLCSVALEILRSEDNVIHVQSPVSVCGDVHGDFDNVLSIFDIFGDAPDGRYLFLGDYVDRGSKSVETVSYLLALKVKYPSDFFLIRGNHESSLPTITFGFYNEIMNKYSDFMIWRTFMEVFKCLPIVAIIDNSIFCVHGGLSPKLHDVSQLDVLDRFIVHPTTGILNDILWSDPSDCKGFITSPRQAG